jgi:hypothetical protein
MSSLYKQLCSRPNFWARLEMHSTRHFEILGCFRFHRGVGRKPASLLLPLRLSKIRASSLPF